MSTNITAAFTTQWADDVKHAYQQRGSKLIDTVRCAKNVNGSSYNFHKMGTVTANTKGRDAEITPLNPAQSIVTATLADYYAGIYHDKLDELKSNVDLRKDFVLESAGSIGRAIDDVIITAANAATNTTTTQTGGLTFAKLQEIITFFNNSDVDPEDRVLVVGSNQLTQALGITQLTSADYTTINAINTGSIGSILGMKWILSTRLPNTNNHVPTSVTTCFAFNKRALGVAMAQDLKTEVNYIPTRVAYLVNTYVSLGSVIIDNAGITKMLCVE